MADIVDNTTGVEVSPTGAPPVEAAFPWYLIPITAGIAYVFLRKG